MNSKRLGIGQIARTVKNIELSLDWYCDTLGLNHLFTFGSMAFLDADGFRILLTQTDEVEKNESIIYFKTSDIRSHSQHLQKLGVEFTHAPHKIHQHEDGSEEWMAFFTDLEGRPLGLMCEYPAN